MESTSVVSPTASTSARPGARRSVSCITSSASTAMRRTAGSSALRICESLRTNRSMVMRAVGREKAYAFARSGLWMTPTATSASPESSWRRASVQGSIRNSGYSPISAATARIRSMSKPAGALLRTNW